MQPFYQEHYGVASMEDSGQKVAETIAAQPADHAVVVLAHNGRTGLGRRRTNICGLDWKIDAGEATLMCVLLRPCDTNLEC